MEKRTEGNIRKGGRDQKRKEMAGRVGKKVERREGKIIEDTGGDKKRG